VITETGGNPPYHRVAWFFLLHVAANGRSVTLTRLPITVPGSLAVDAAEVSPDGTRLATQEQSCYRHGCYYTGIRVVSKAEIVELSARTGKLLRILSTTTVHGATRRGPGSAGILDEDCGVLSLVPAGTNVLVSCFTFGRVDNNSFTPLPGFPSGSSGGIGGQDTAAW
jgi:hypothetical protein